MPFTALATPPKGDFQAKRVNTLLFNCKQELFSRYPDHEFFCPECNSAFIPKRLRDTVFFAHKPVQNRQECSIGARYTRTHNECSITLFEELVKRGVQREQIFPEKSFGERRADMCITDNAGRPLVVFEIQLSFIDVFEFLSRTKFYYDRNIDCIWLFKNGSRLGGCIDTCKYKFNYYYDVFEEKEDNSIEIAENFDLVWQERIYPRINHQKSGVWNFYHLVDWDTDGYRKEREIIRDHKTLLYKLWEEKKSPQQIIQEIERAKKEEEEKQKRWKEEREEQRRQERQEEQKRWNQTREGKEEAKKRWNEKSEVLRKEKEEKLKNLRGYTESKYPDRRYRVNSFGQTFKICKPLGTIKTALGTYYHFESVDPEFPEWKGHKFYCFRKEDFTEIT